MAEYKFYMQPVNKDGDTLGPAYNLEQSFPGLRYRACRGLNTIGAPKNIYTEDYADGDGLRVFHPKDVLGEVKHEATDVEIDFVFVGEEGKVAYRSFCSFLERSRFLYWDTARNRRALLVLTEMVEPDEDTVKGTIYLTATFKFKNVWGKTEAV